MTVGRPGTRTTIQLGAQLHAEVKRCAAEAEQTMQDYMVQAIRGRVQSDNATYPEEALIAEGYEKCTPELLKEYPTICLNEDHSLRKIDKNGSHWHKMYFPRPEHYVIKDGERYDIPNNDRPRRVRSSDAARIRRDDSLHSD